jgi:beta-galactosidase
MKSKFFKSLLAATMVLTMTPVSSVAAWTGFEGEEWYDEVDTVEFNREYAHSFFVPYQDAETALKNEQSI